MDRERGANNTALVEHTVFVVSASATGGNHKLYAMKRQTTGNFVDRSVGENRRKSSVLLKLRALGVMSLGECRTSFRNVFLIKNDISGEMKNVHINIFMSFHQLDALNSQRIKSRPNYMIILTTKGFVNRQCQGERTFRKE